MSGTSHDAVDCAVVDIAPGTGFPQALPQALNVKVLIHCHLPYSREMRQSIRQAFHGTTEDICRLHAGLGEVFAQAVLTTVEKAGLKAADIDAIASHGQTVHHIPPVQGKEGQRGQAGSTLQIGSPTVIAYRTGITVVSDFRSKDMAAGGQGAPLVPLADYLLFRSPSLIRAVLNIGGMANVTILTQDMDGTIAFDTGPGNALMDDAVRLFTKGAQEYDDQGCMASAGMVQEGLLEELLGHPYFTRKPPKSTGREVFGCLMVENMQNRYPGLSKEDLLATLAHLTCRTIMDAIGPYGPDELIVTGGGCKNGFLMNLLKEECRQRAILYSDITAYGFTPEAKEAVSFAILGYRTLQMLHGNIPSATGAREKVVLGSITPP